MRSATDFLPSFMIEFMNLDTTASPNLGSGLISRLSALRRRDMCLFPYLALAWPLPCLSRAIFGCVGCMCDCRSYGHCKKQTTHYLGRFAPYLERLCLRSATPCVSSTPRMMW